MGSDRIWCVGKGIYPVKEWETCCNGRQLCDRDHMDVVIVLSVKQILFEEPSDDVYIRCLPQYVTFFCLLDPGQLWHRTKNP